MSAQPKVVECESHGPQPEAFVCQHVARSLWTNEPVGFFWSTESETPRPDAWCLECEERVQKTGGEWIGEADANLGVTLICGSCYDRAREMNLGQKGAGA